MQSSGQAGQAAASQLNVYVGNAWQVAQVAVR